MHCLSRLTGISSAFLFLFFWLTATANAQAKKTALLIGIGQYPQGSGWPALHGDRDADAIKQALLQTGFEESRTFTLKNEAATKAGISAALKNLLDAAAAGDVLLIHFSGHGQQVTDLNGDEADGLDEALIPYDAPANEKAAGNAYNGGKHFLDDELGDWFVRLRKRLGPAGQLIVFVDACHSGTVSRGNAVVRGDAPPFLFAKNQPLPKAASKPAEESGYAEIAPANENTSSKFVLIAAARAGEPDYEYTALQLGSLSYALADALQNKLRSSAATFRDLFEYVRNTMAVVASSQNPQIEGDKDLTIFNGSLQAQQAFYAVDGYDKDGLLKVQAGRVLGIVPGTEVGLFPVGTRNTDGAKPIATGKVVAADYLKSSVRLEKKLSSQEAVALRAFVLQPVFDNAQTKVFIGNLPAAAGAKLREALTAKKVTVVPDAASAVLLVKANGGLIELVNAANGLPLVAPVDPNAGVALTNCEGAAAGGAEPVAYLTKVIGNYARNSVLKKASFSDDHFGLKVSLLPAVIDPQTAAAKPVPQAQNNPSFNTQNSQAVLRVENTGTRAGYVYLLEFDPAGKICPVLGFASEVKLSPGAKDDTVLDGFVPPCGRYFIKGYITEQPIGNELLWLVTDQEGKARSSVHPFVALLGSLIENPGVARTGVQRASGGVSVADFAYELTAQ